MKLVFTPDVNGCDRLYGRELSRNGANRIAVISMSMDDIYVVFSNNPRDFRSTSEERLPAAPGNRDQVDARAMGGFDEWLLPVSVACKVGDMDIEPGAIEGSPPVDHDTFYSTEPW